MRRCGDCSYFEGLGLGPDGRALGTCPWAPGLSWPASLRSCQEFLTLPLRNGRSGSPESLGERAGGGEVDHAVP